MTILEEARFGRKGSIYGQLYEAPVHQSKGFQREEWKYFGKPFFSPALICFWETYSKPFSKRDMVFLSPEEELGERVRFIQRPIVVAVDKSFSEKAAIGGIWIDRVTSPARGRDASFHIKVRRDAREYAYPLLDFFIKCFERQYDSVSTEWGPREEQDNPKKFLINNGFKVNGGSEGGNAILKLRERCIVNRIPLVSLLDH